jgi:hypothetical protein
MKAPAFNLDRPQPGEAVIYWDRNQRQHVGVLVRYDPKHAIVHHALKGDVKVGVDDVKRQP